MDGAGDDADVVDAVPVAVVDEAIVANAADDVAAAAADVGVDDDDGTVVPLMSPFWSGDDGDPLWTCCWWCSEAVSGVCIFAAYGE